MPHVYRAVLLLTLVGCYSPSYSNCTIACTDSCPNGLTCDSQLHMCRTQGSTCSPGGGGDAGRDSGGGSDANIAMDAMHDAPRDAPPPGCTLRQETEGTSQGPNLTVDLSTSPIPAGDFVVVTIAAHGPGTAFTVSDLNGHQFNQAIKAQYTNTSTGSSITSAIYYFLSSPVQISTVNVNFTNNVYQGAVIGDWQCTTPPSAQTRTAMASGASAGNSTNAGAMMLGARSIVVGSIGYPGNAGFALNTPGLTLLDGFGLGGASMDINSLTGWGVYPQGQAVDVTFSTMPGMMFAVTGAAFTVP